ncbi:MAG TPA: M6 family metalloprotease domain-containing protein, partial [Fibrobacteraceae bacterium]|nr:M6 family metalloprotease domain-containing protein [Fibrobacteraceae bacterium]
YANNDGSISPYKARGVTERTSSEAAFLGTLDKSGIIKEYVAGTTPKTFGKPTASNTNVKRRPTADGITSGTKSFPVFLVSTSVATFSTDSADWWAQLNEEGYSTNGHIGSVRDYFIDQSSGAFVPTYDVYGPITLSGTLSSMTDSAIIAQAMASVDSKVDFSDYDGDGDGEIDGIGIVVAGQSSDNGGHGVYQGYMGGSFKKDNTSINKYLMTNEMSDANASYMDGMGSFTHEFGHMLGLMDLYQLSGTDSRTPGYWDVMDVGCYNGTSSNGGVWGTVVPNWSAFERQSVGWITPTELTTSTDVTAIPTIDNNAAYTVSTSDNDEWFLMENRQQSGWDTYVPGHGMLIWHIDYDETIWNSNALSNTASHQYADIEEASTSATDAYPYPGTASVTSFSNFVNWSGTDMGIDLYNITESSGNICFTTTSSVSVTNCVVSSTATSSAASSSSVASSSSSATSSCSGLSSSSATSSSGTVFDSIVVLTISRLSGDTVQSINQGDSIADIIFKTTNGTNITITGLENTGLSTDTATSSGALRLTISGIASGSAATYSYTVTASADGMNDSSLTGSITVISTSSTLARNTFRSQIQIVGRHLFVASTALGGKTLHVLDLNGRELQSVSFSGNSADLSLSNAVGKGVFVLRLCAGNKLLERRVVPVM